MLLGVVLAERVALLLKGVGVVGLCGLVLSLVLVLFLLVHVVLHFLDLGQLFVLFFLKDVPQFGLFVAHITYIFCVHASRNFGGLVVFVVLVDLALAETDLARALLARLLHNTLGSCRLGVFSHCS